MQNVDMKAAVLAIASLLSACARAPARPTVVEPAPAVREVTLAPERGLIRQLQLELIRGGYLKGAADGVAGPRTSSAIGRFQSANGLPVNGTPSWGLLRRLRTATARNNEVNPIATKPAAESPGSNWVAPAPAIGPAPPPSSPAPSANWVAPPARAPSTISQ